MFVEEAPPTDTLLVLLSATLPLFSNKFPGDVEWLFDEEILEELTNLFPELDVETGKGYSPSVRMSLKSYEADTLFGVAA